MPPSAAVAAHRRSARCAPVSPPAAWPPLAAEHVPPGQAADHGVVPMISIRPPRDAAAEQCPRCRADRHRRALDSAMATAFGDVRPRRCGRRTGPRRSTAECAGTAHGQLGWRPRSQSNSGHRSALQQHGHRPPHWRSIAPAPTTTRDHRSCGSTWRIRPSVPAKSRLTVTPVKRWGVRPGRTRRRRHQNTTGMPGTPRRRARA